MVEYISSLLPALTAYWDWSSHLRRTQIHIIIVFLHVIGLECEVQNPLGIQYVLGFNNCMVPGLIWD